MSAFVRGNGKRGRAQFKTFTGDEKKQTKRDEKRMNTDFLHKLSYATKSAAITCDALSLISNSLNIIFCAETPCTWLSARDKRSFRLCVYRSKQRYQ